MSLIKVKVVRFHLVQAKLRCIFLPPVLKPIAASQNGGAHECFYKTFKGKKHNFQANAKNIFFLKLKYNKINSH